MIFVRAVVLDLDFGHNVYNISFLYFLKRRQRGGTMVGLERERRIMGVEEEYFATQQSGTTWREHLRRDG